MNPTSLPNRSARMVALLALGSLSTVALADIIENQWSDVQTPTNDSTFSFGGGDVTGDFDGDGYDDRMYSYGTDRRGAVQWGGAAGLDATDVDESNTLVMLRAFSMGDLDGDGYDDLIGAFGGGSAARSVRVVFGSAAGIDWSQASSTASRPAFTGMSSAVLNDQYTSTGGATSGDFDGDGFPDAVMTSKVGKHWATGMKAWVWYGQSDGSGPDFSTASTLQASDQNIASVRSEYGRNIVSGDFNDDGYDDLAVGAHVATYANYPNTGAGAVYVYYGSASGLTQGSQTKLQLASPEPGDFYGRAVAVGDVTGDGVDDLISISQMIGSSSTTCDTITIHEGGNGSAFSASDRTELEYCDSELQWVNVAEVTGDGIDDIILTTGGSPVIIPGSDAGITVDDAFATCGAAGIIVPGDFNGDGDDDLVSTSGVQWINGAGTLDADCDGTVDVVNTDGDGVCDDTDTDDTDLDGVADDCDAFPIDPSEWDDTDGDGVGDNGDAFPGDATESADTDGDGVGDNSDTFPEDATESADTDGDGLGDNADLCPDEAPGDFDTNGDGCLDDTDGDGFTDDIDAFPEDDSEWYDYDGDGVGDNSDAFPMDATESTDTDGDGVGDNSDGCFGFPNDDTDGDGVCDSDDVCPTDATDTDDDNDGVCDVEDICVGTDNVDDDGDQICNDLDACEGNDAAGDNDADGYCDDVDNCPDDDNADQADADADGIGDECEADSDGDGIIDDDDNCVDDMNFDQSDNDGDGDGDACDTDDDGDGVADESDNCPFYANSTQVDTDGDGFGDVCDGDDDADGVADESDLCAGTPLDAPFDDNGCSGEQRVELVCGSPEDYSWRRSGRYIRCVVKESRAAKRAGLITKRERAWLIKRATIEMWLQRWTSRLRRWC